MATRLYFSLTNHCNLRCPFCCMHSGPEKGTYLSVSKFREIINNTEGELEVQLEGGEPLLHRDWGYLLQLAIGTMRCRKIIICTNGIKLPEYADFISLSAINVPIELKVSINHHILDHYPEAIENLRKMVDTWPTYKMDDDWPKIAFKINVRLRNKHVDASIVYSLDKADLLSRSNVFYLQRYGRAKNREELNLPTIVQNIDDWQVFASDGTYFGQDLIARSEYEETLP